MPHAAAGKMRRIQRQKNAAIDLPVDALWRCSAAERFLLKRHPPAGVQPASDRPGCSAAERFLLKRLLASGLRAQIGFAALPAEPTELKRFPGVETPRAASTKAEAADGAYARCERTRSSSALVAAMPSRSGN